MTRAPQIKGWCPGALRPMVSGDGLVVRVRPFGGRLSPEQARGIAALAQSHGNGLIDLSSRANVQLRGVRQDTHAPLIDGLRDLGLIDADVQAESRRNVLVTPFWDAGDGTTDLAQALTDASPWCRTPLPISGWNAMRRARCWSAPKAGVSAKRSRSKPPWPEPGTVAQGTLAALALGQMEAATLTALADLGALRTTPWRMLLVEGAAALPSALDLITDANDPLLRVVACTGAPACLQAHGDTRTLARQLAPHVPQGQRLHMSGCTKGCAHPGIAPLTVTVTPDGLSLIRDGAAGGHTDETGLTPDDITKAI